MRGRRREVDTEKQRNLERQRYEERDRQTEQKTRNDDSLEDLPNMKEKREKNVFSLRKEAFSLLPKV